MDINGIQKLTLLDFPGRTACTVFLAGCDMRCPFCHNSELWTMDAPAAMDEEEFFGFLEKRRGLIDGVAITGGEPTLRTELPDFIRRIKDMGYAVKLDTNGRAPDMLGKLIGAGLLDYAAMDIKNDIERYPVTCGRKDMDLDAILESIDVLKTSAPDYEFRTTVVSQLHDNKSFENIARLIEGANNYFLQPFADRDTVKFSGFTAPTEDEMLAYLDIVRPFVKNAEVRGMG